MRRGKLFDFGKSIKKRAAFTVRNQTLNKKVLKMKKNETSKIQKQFWILNEIYQNSGAYNLFSVFELSKHLNLNICSLQLNHS